jgi:LmbE family N-acetylglucosaminyl deacetylase
MKKKILIIAPHPDDEILGCGGIMKKFACVGDEVYVLVVTRGTPKMYSDDRIDNVRREAIKAHQILGVSETRFFDFHAPELDITSNAAISIKISALLAEWQISDLYLPHRGDIHHDHGVVFNASLVAARPVGNYTVKNIYCYETLSETEWAPPFGNDAFIPNHFINIEMEMESKLEAMRCFKSQVRPFPSTRSLETIEALAKFRGATVGFKRAEAFMTIRTINN